MKAPDLTDHERERLVDMRGGCSCHLSPPCPAHSDPVTDAELDELRDEIVDAEFEAPKEVD